MMERKVLGKGLSALIPETGLRAGEKVTNIQVEEIIPSRYQPRQEFKPDREQELLSSIREKGIIQPILVRRIRETEVAGARYELIAGERRLRAARALGKIEIPAVVKEATDEEAVELSLIENIQREQLNPVEEAEAYERLLDEFGLTQEKIAQAVGRERVSVANTLRLLKLPEKIKEWIRQGEISGGHARALLGLATQKEQLELAGKVIRRGLSVRETENRVRKRKQTPGGAPGRKKDHHLVAMEEELQRALGTRVRIIAGRKRGRIQIEYYSSDDLERLLHILKSAGI